MGVEKTLPESGGGGREQKQAGDGLRTSGLLLLDWRAISGRTSYRRPSLEKNTNKSRGHCPTRLRRLPNH